ncbi:hypothetical protein [Endozoicomonas sp.]|uniref:hypothetical protein n=1 Tax=Endozoicomonas sp. TaxID=1892382 RepID=UPI0028875593|nr:hypothetical protein [Endozoicomonas sp.]
MKIQKSLQVLRDAAKARFDRLGKTKKNIPLPPNNGAENSGKTLFQRQAKMLGAQPPVLQSTETDKKEISMTLWSHWSGKTPKEVEKCYSQLEKVNGSVLLTIEQLLRDRHQVSACQVPGVLVRTKQNVFSDFANRLSVLLDKVLSEDTSLRDRIYQSDGVLKTPVLITRLDNKESLMRSESLEAVSTGVYFYPYVDTASCSATSMLTLYIDDHNMSESALMNGLKEGLRKATHHADDNLPKLPDASGVSGWSDVMNYYEVTKESELLKKFKVSEVAELPDLSEMSDWSALPDKYLKSREIIQKYLR